MKVTVIRRLKGFAKQHRSTKRVRLWLMRTLAPVFQIINVLAIPRYMTFLGDWLRFRKAGGVARVLDFYPCLNDRTTTTGIDTHYFNQAIWAFRRIMSSGVRMHVDVGSDVRFVGLLTTVTNVTFVDIRPPEIELAGLVCRNGSILSLPFGDKSVSSLSSMHVIEHIGLGRYGDPIDPYGSIKAGKELTRVLAQGGKLYLTAPIGESRVQFNSQRVFSVTEVINMFSGLRLTEFAIVDTDGVYRENVDPASVKLRENTGQDCGLGLFVFQPA